MTNFEQSLPRFSTYQEIVKKTGYSYSSSFKKEIGELFDQSKWEDRLLMLAFIMFFSELKTDNRPSFSKWVKKHYISIDRCTESYLSIIDDDDHAKTFLSLGFGESADKIDLDNFRTILREWSTYSESEKRNKLTLNLMGAYQTQYPDSMVVPTEMGKQCFSSCKKLSQNKLVKEYIDGLYYSLTSFLESAFSKTKVHRNNNEILHLHKYDFNWSEILHLVWKIDLISWWYREHLSEYDPCWGRDVTSIPHLSTGEYENTNTYLTQCALPRLFNAYGVDCKEYEKECYTMMYTWYSSESDPYDEEEMNERIEDIWSEIHTHWTNKYGEL